MILFPPLFALTAAVLFGLSVHIQRMGLADTDDLTGTMISVSTIAVLCWLVSPFVIEWRWWATEAAFLFAACGLLFPAMGQRLQIASVVRVGPSLTATLGSFAPAFAIIPAVIFLGEVINLQATIGLAIMIGALILTVLEPKGVHRSWSTFVLLLPLGASFVRGIVQPVAKFGYADVHSPFFATLVMASVSTIVIGLFRVFSNSKEAKPGSTRGYRLFVLNGLIVGSGIFAMQIALSNGEVIVVAPLVSTAPLWALLIGALFFRHEQLGARRTLSALLVFVGIVLVVTRNSY